MSRPKTADLDRYLLQHAAEVLTLIFGAENVRESSGDEIDLINAARGDQQFGSFKFNRRTGKWSDFAVEGMAGKGFCQLVAKLNGYGVGEAVRQIEGELLPHLNGAEAQEPEKPKRKRQTAEELKVEPVDADDAAKIDEMPTLHPELGFASAVYRYMTDTGEALSFAVLRFEVDGKKETRPLAWSAERGEWIWRYPPLPLRPYLKGTVPWRDADSLTGEPKEIPEGIIVVEGEKCTDHAAARFPGWCVMTSARGSGEAGATDWAVLKHAKRILIIPDADGPGRGYALDVVGQALLHCGDITIGVADVAKLGWKHGEDIADHDVSLDELMDATVDAEDIPPEALQAHVATAAASVDAGTYARAKEKLATRLGIGQRDLDKLVKAAKEKLGVGSEHADEDDAEEQEDAPRTAAPCEGPVDAAEVFAEVRTAILRFCFLPEEAADAVALWLMLSWKSRDRAVNTMPLLMLTSPMKRCGKSTLIEVMMCLCNRPLVASNVSSATIFRAIGAWEPAVLLDEADTYLADNAELGGVLNSGHRRSTAKVWRVEERDGVHVPVAYSTWAPKVIAGIGRHASDTLVDRSIVIRLARKPADIKVQRLNPDRLEDEMGPLRSQLARWALDAALPEEMEDQLQHLNDRSAMNWSQLLRVATTCSPEIARKCLEATRLMGSSEDMLQDRGADLLSDIRQVLPALRKEAEAKGAYATERAADGSTTKAYHYPSGIIVKALNALEDRPWSDYSKGKGITSWTLSSMLRPFKLETTVAWGGGAAAKQSIRGYAEVALKKVFNQYLDGPDPDQEGK